MRCSRGIPIYNYTLQSPYYGKHNPITALLIIISFHGFEKVHISVVGCYCGGGWSSYRVCHLPLLLTRAPPSPPHHTRPGRKGHYFSHTPRARRTPFSPPPTHLTIPILNTTSFHICFYHIPIHRIYSILLRCNTRQTCPLFVYTYSVLLVTFAVGGGRSLWCDLCCSFVFGLVYFGVLCPLDYIDCGG